MTDRDQQTDHDRVGTHAAGTRSPVTGDGQWRIQSANAVRSEHSLSPATCRLLPVSEICPDVETSAIDRRFDFISLAQRARSMTIRSVGTLDGVETSALDLRTDVMRSMNNVVIGETQERR